MKATAKLRYIRIAPRKVRLVADQVRGKKVKEAQRVLGFTMNRASLPVLKTLLSAMAAARNNFEGEEANLYISNITIDEGPKFKRYRARARGAAYPIQKKTSHITIVIDEIEEVKREKKKSMKKTTETSKAGTAQTRTTPLTSVEPDSTTAGKETPPDKPIYRPETGREVPKPRKESRIKRLFRRKAI
ncbi:50S ribosomal protein L22 [Patescibacteria group bacterium]|nr:50S ribosomal protein L22 [Patescibacteria group bacterium]